MSFDRPLRLLGPEAFSAALSFLERAGYNEANVCEFLEIDRICDLEQVDFSRFSKAVPTEASLLSLLVQVFFLLQDVPAHEIELAFSNDEVEVLQTLDLLRRTEGHLFSSTVWLYPVEGLILASDRDKHLQDAVFPAISPLSYRFLKRMSRSPAVEALDLCSGSGVAALLLGKYCQHVIAADVSPRAVHFARFNCQLNSGSHVNAVESDFYSALEGRTFDRIVAHPPYVPSLSNAVVWRDGGATGEEPTRRIVEGLPQFLRPEGTFYACCGGFDTRELPFEQRVRSWIGASNEWFDVLFAVEFDKSPWHLAGGSQSHAAEAGGQPLFERFREIGAVNFVTGALFIYRRAETASAQARPPLTVRSLLSPLTDGSCFDTCLIWWRWVAGTQTPQALGQLKPRLGSTLRVNITHVIQDQELVPEAFRLEASRPFQSESKVDPEMVQVLLKCDGRTSLEELYKIAQKASWVPPHLALVDFLKFAAKMIERGYLEVELSALRAS